MLNEPFDVQPTKSKRNIREEIHQLKSILCIKQEDEEGHKNFQQVMTIVNDCIENNDQIDRFAFKTLLHRIFPEIKQFSQYNREGMELI